MAATNGFSTVAPDARYGNTAPEEGHLVAQRFQCPGTGPITITEIGTYVYGLGTPRMYFAIFTDDGSYPEAEVENSNSGEKVVSAGWGFCSHTYVTQPTLTGGDYYWIVSFGNSDPILSAFASGGTVRRGGAAYPTFPTGAVWHDYGASTKDYANYAVYSAAAGGLSIPVAMYHYLHH